MKVTKLGVTEEAAGSVREVHRYHLGPAKLPENDVPSYMYSSAFWGSLLIPHPNPFPPEGACPPRTSITR